MQTNATVQQQIFIMKVKMLCFMVCSFNFMQLYDFRGVVCDSIEFMSVSPINPYW